ncbi:MAG: CoA pyrophosphatase [Desulfuromonadales bacterium]
MTGKIVKQSHMFQQISELLVVKEHDMPPDSEGRTRASVAMILCQAQDDPEMLFIQRAADANDPWSGHIAFPGGKQEEGELVCQTARRETREEIGIDLEMGRFLGRLSDIVGANLPVRVSCCLFVVDQATCVPELSGEVSDVFWVRLSDLRDRTRHIQSNVAFDDRKFEVPAFRLPCVGKPVLWGITYRLVMQFLELLDYVDRGVAHSEEYGTLPESIQLYEEDNRRNSSLRKKCDQHNFPPPQKVSVPP